MSKKLVGTYENPTRKDVDRIMVDAEMARKKQELDAKGSKLVGVLPFEASGHDALRALLKQARSGELKR